LAAGISANHLTDAIEFVGGDNDPANGTRPATVPVPALKL
jgi:hypothetical protein